MDVLNGEGILGKMFDLNQDGKVDCLEQTMEFMCLDRLFEEEQKAKKASSRNGLLNDTDDDQ